MIFFHFYDTQKKIVGHSELSNIYGPYIWAITRPESDAKGAFIGVGGIFRTAT